MFRQGQLAVHGLAILLGRNEAGISNRGKNFLLHAVQPSDLKIPYYRKLQVKYETSRPLKSKSEMLIPYMFHHGDIGIQRIADTLTSRLLGGSNNLKEWRRLLGVSWKR